MSISSEMLSSEMSSEDDGDDEEVNSEETRTNSMDNVTASRTKKRPNQSLGRLTIGQKLDALDYYHIAKKKNNRNEGNKQWHPVSMTHTYIRETLNRPTYQKSSVRYLVKNEESIRKRGKTNKTKMLMDPPRSGRYPEMEDRVSLWLTEVRGQDIIVETWMLPYEGKKILHQLYPWKFGEPDSESEAEDDAVAEGQRFKFSNSWMRGFLKRFNWTLRTITNKKNWKLEKELGMKLVQDFHVDTRAFQLTNMKGLVFGIASPRNVFNLDQVPINLAQSSNQTINEKGAREVYDGVSKASDVKRFCTLNLMIPMEVNEDSSNIPKPHIIFSASGYKVGDDWAATERDGLIM